MTRLLPLVITVAVVCAACGSSPSSPSSTTTTTATSGPSTEVIDLTVPPSGAAFYSFNVTTAGTVTADLASVQASLKPPPLPLVLRLGVGVPAGEGCTVTQSIDTGPSLTSQLTTSLASGVWCISVADTGTLPQPVVVGVRFTHS